MDQADPFQAQEKALAAPSKKLLYAPSQPKIHWHSPLP
jgi:hypothetical protein